MLNSDVFFTTVESMSGATREMLIPVQNSFYTNEFKMVRDCARPDKNVPLVIEELKSKGYRLIIATNPLFPRIATDERIRWAGLSPDDFEYISYYDNSSWCKPSLGFYKEILKKRGLDASQCIMIGNDVTEDMRAVELGFKGFLVLDNVIGDLERVPECERGDYSDLLDFARSLPTLERNII
jgi:HAD superfamily hydrolase (TIGR01549 family)